MILSYPKPLRIRRKEENSEEPEGSSLLYTLWSAPGAGAFPRWTDQRPG